MMPLGCSAAGEGGGRADEARTFARTQSSTAFTRRLDKGGLAGSGGGQDAWMTTYTDMVTLLLTLFVFLVGMSDLKKEPVPHGAQAADPVSAMAPPRPESEPEPEPVSDTVQQLADAPPAPPDVAWLIDRAKELEEFVVTRELQDHVRIERTERAILVQLRDGFLFASARAELTADGVALVRRLAEFMARLPGEIEVEGHTDPIPIATGRYPSNWELSAARAAAVARRLIDNGVPARRLRAIGYADTRPVASNATPEGRATNRRVTLMILARAPATQPPQAGEKKAQS